MAIVSFSRRFIFVKTRKTAGTSVQESLLSACADGDVATTVWTNVLDQSKCPIQEFASLEEIEETYGLGRQDFYSFGFTRNPYALTLSRYLYQVRMERVKEEPTRSNFNRWVQQVYFVGEEGFSRGRYIKDRSRLLLFDETLQPAVNFIGRFERLAQDYGSVLDTLGIALESPLLHVNQSNAGGVSYQEWLDSDSRGLVEANFDFELEYFGYRF